MAMTSKSAPLASSRRDFLATVGLSALGTALSANAGAVESPAPSLADPTRILSPSQANLGTLFADVEKIADTGRYSYAYRSGRFASYEAFQHEARAKLFELLLYRPEPVDPRPEVLERVDCGEYFRERVTFATSPVLRVPAYVLIPKNLKAPAPAMVDLHSHGGMFLFGKEKVVDLGSNHPAMAGYHDVNYEGRPTATALVRRGYVVITIDACMFGERRVMMDADFKLGWDRSKYSAGDVTRLNQVCRSKEATIVKALTLAGASWPGLVFWDDIRTVDYLATRPEVDPRRIGCQGVSMGGYRALFLAALDTRIRAACVVGFMSTVRPMLQAHVDTHSFVHFLPALHSYLDWPDIASLTAPRSLMVLQCSRDQLFPLGGMKEAVEKITAGYEHAGVKDRFVGRFYDVPHCYTRQMQDDAFVWFESRLSAAG
jgi:dienelactone hydrolase